MHELAPREGLTHDGLLLQLGVARMIEPSAGTARVCGFDLRNEPLEVKRRVGFVPESGAVFESLTGLEYLQMVAALYDRPDLACGAKDFVWIDGPTTRTIRVCSAKNPRIAQYDFMFFGGTRPETRPGTKAGGSRFHQCPSAARAG